MEENILKKKIADLIASKAEIAGVDDDKEFSVIDDFKYDDLANEMENIALEFAVECLEDLKLGMAGYSLLANKVNLFNQTIENLKNRKNG
jgi:hypothetical protein